VGTPRRFAAIVEPSRQVVRDFGEASIFQTLRNFHVRDDRRTAILVLLLVGVFTFFLDGNTPGSIKRGIEAACGALRECDTLAGFDRVTVAVARFARVTEAWRRQSFASERGAQAMCAVRIELTGVASAQLADWTHARRDFRIHDLTLSFAIA
jgi:hypothetical protein